MLILLTDDGPGTIRAKGSKNFSPLPDWYQSGRHRFDHLIAKKWTELAGIDGSIFSGHTPQRGAIPERRCTRRPYRTFTAALWPGCI